LHPSKPDVLFEALSYASHFQLDWKSLFSILLHENFDFGMHSFIKKIVGQYH